MPEDTDATFDRRTMLAMTAAAITGGVAACAHGADGDPAAAASNRRRRFENKIVLITGATSGIGRAAAEQFATEGGKVTFCGRRINLGHEVEAGIRARGGEATYIHADVRDDQTVSIKAPMFEKLARFSMPSWIPNQNEVHHFAAQLP